MTILLKQIQECIFNKLSHFTTDTIFIDDNEFIIGSTKNSDHSNIYLVLDTDEGSGCVGHWLHECVSYTLFFKKLKDIYPNLKVLCSGYKRYKEQFCNMSGIPSESICYTSNSIPVIIFHNNEEMGNQLYFPKDDEYTVIYPEYTYFRFTGLFSNRDTEYTIRYRNLLKLYKQSLPFTPDVNKDIDCVYMIRSRDIKENYSNNRINFVNIEDVISLMKIKNIPIYDVADFSSIEEQIKIVERAKTIIAEHGSPRFINGALLSRNSHIIILNKMNVPSIELEESLTKENNNTYEYIENISNDAYNIHIPIDKLEYALRRRNI
jgi:hypothetical protein